VFDRPAPEAPRVDNPEALRAAVPTWRELLKDRGVPELSAKPTAPDFVVELNAKRAAEAITVTRILASVERLIASATPRTLERLLVTLELYERNGGQGGRP